MAVFTSGQEFFVSNSQSKKFELIQKSCVPRALRFSCKGPSRLREAKKAMGTRMVHMCVRDPDILVPIALFASLSRLGPWHEKRRALGTQDFQS